MMSSSRSHISFCAMVRTMARPANFLIAHRREAVTNLANPRRQLDALVTPPGPVRAIRLLVEALAIHDSAGGDELHEQGFPFRSFGLVGDDEYIIAAVNA